MNLFDASALLWFLQDDDGADRVEAALLDGGACGAANWSETAQKVRQRGGDCAIARGLLEGYGLTVVPVEQPDAERAAELRDHSSSLSLGDRLCLAMGERLDAVVWTADASWGSAGRMRQVR